MFPLDKMKRVEERAIAFPWKSQGINLVGSIVFKHTNRKCLTQAPMAMF